MPYVLTVLAGLVVGVITTLVGVLIWLERMGRQRQFEFQQRGTTTEALVEGSVLDEGMWAVSYRFYDRHGVEQLGIDFLDANRHEPPAEGSKLRIVYLPDQPGISGLALLWLGHRTPVR